MPTDIALSKASHLGLDLVEISPKANPPVCKIMDFGKYRYEAKKNSQKAKKKQKVIDTKEIRLRPTIGEHDLQVKVTQIRSFINKGEKVKVSLRFKGREISHFDVGEGVIDKVIARVSDVATPESPPKREGNQIAAMLCSNQVKKL